MVTRVRVEAEGKTPNDVIASLDWASNALGFKFADHRGTFASSDALAEVTEEVITRHLDHENGEPTGGTVYVGRRVVKLYPVIG